MGNYFSDLSENTGTAHGFTVLRFRTGDRKNVTELDIARLESFGFVAVFTDYAPDVVVPAATE